MLIHCTRERELQCNECEKSKIDLLKLAKLLLSSKTCRKNSIIKTPKLRCNTNPHTDCQSPLPIFRNNPKMFQTSFSYDLCIVRGAAISRTIKHIGTMHLLSVVLKAAIFLKNCKLCLILEI